MNIVIVEDEAPAARRLKKLVQDIDKEIDVCAVLDSIEASVDWFAHNPPPDLVLMDIELADGQSFEIFNRVKLSVPVIFTTAYDEFALKAFKVNSIDYLLKPIEQEALEQSIAKFKGLRGVATAPHNIEKLLQTMLPPTGGKNRYLVKTGEKLLSIEKEQVAYFMSEEKMSFLITHTNKKYLLDQSMDELEKTADPHLFFRINRQYLASLSAVAAIHNHFNGKLKLILQPPVKEEVLISRDKAPLFKMWLDS